MAAQGNTVLMEGVRMIFRNFQGKEDRFNKEGNRNFAVVIDEKTYREMLEDEWNVKQLDPREEYQEEGVTYYLPVAIRFDVFPPNVTIVTSRGRQQIGEAQIEMLDWAEILNVDLIVRAHHWDVNGKSGTKAYVKTMFVTIEEDPLEAKYAELGGGGE